MNIKYLVTMAGTDHCHNPGDCCEVDDDEAKRLIEAGFAEPAKVTRKKKIETATEI